MLLLVQTEFLFFNIYLFIFKTRCVSVQENIVDCCLNWLYLTVRKTQQVETNTSQAINQIKWFLHQPDQHCKVFQGSIQKFYYPWCFVQCLLKIVCWLCKHKNFYNAQNIYLWSSQFCQSHNENILKPSKSDLIPAIFKIKTNWSVTSRKILWQRKVL